MSEQKIIDFCKAIMNANNCENVHNANAERGMKALVNKYYSVDDCLDKRAKRSAKLNNKDKS